MTEFLRSHYNGTLIACGSYTPASAEEILNSNKCDLVAFGRPFIANPKFVDQIRLDQKTETYSAEMLMELK